MTPEQINIAIAEIAGTAFEEPIILYADGTTNGRGNTPEYTAQKYANYRSQGIQCELKIVKSTRRDYYSDLNACHEMEISLDYEGVIKFGRLLKQINADHPADFVKWHATAPQRCEAFLRVHNKWENK